MGRWLRFILFQAWPASFLRPKIPCWWSKHHRLTPWILSCCCQHAAAGCWARKRRELGTFMMKAEASLPHTHDHSVIHTPPYRLRPFPRRRSPAQTRLWTAFRIDSGLHSIASLWRVAKQRQSLTMLLALPDELLLKVLHLSVKPREGLNPTRTALRLAATCKKLFQVVDSTDFWQAVFGDAATLKLISSCNKLAQVAQKAVHQLVLHETSSWSEVAVALPSLRALQVCLSS